MPFSRKSSNLSNYFKELRVKRDLSPGELASLISRNNIPKVGNIIRTFEISGQINSHWFELLVNELKPNPILMEQKIKADIEDQKNSWNKYISKSIDPFLTIRYIPGFYGTKKIPFCFLNSRNDAEEWAATELKKYRAKGFLDWSREEQTIFDKGGSNPRRIKIGFQQQRCAAWMQFSGSAKKFILNEDNSLNFLIE